MLVELYEEVLLAECLLSTHSFVTYRDIDPGISQFENVLYAVSPSDRLRDVDVGRDASLGTEIV